MPQVDLNTMSAETSGSKAQTATSKSRVASAKVNESIKTDKSAKNKSSAKTAGLSKTGEATKKSKSVKTKSSAKSVKGTKSGKSTIAKKASTGKKNLHQSKQAPSIGVVGTNEMPEAFTLLSESERYDVMSKLQAQNPNPKSELNFKNNFELICAVVLSAQATDVSVNLVTPKLFALAPDAHSMAQLSVDEIGNIIKTVGLWKNKARNLSALAKILDEQYGGEVPSNYEQLLALPGVGSKTAKVVLNVAFGLPYIAVDTHVFRVCNRIGLCLGNSPAQVEERLPPLVPQEFLKEAHHYLLLHGRYNCTAKKYEEHCPNCVVKSWCRTYAQAAKTDKTDKTV